MKKTKAILLAAALPMAMVISAPAQALLMIDDFGTQAVGTIPGVAYAAADNTADGNPNPMPPLVAGPVGNNIVMTVLPATGPTIGAGWSRSIQANLASGDQVETEICNFCQAGHLVSNAGSTGTGSFIYTGGIVNLTSYGSSIMFDYAADLAGAVVRFSFTGSDTGFIDSAVLASTGTSAPSNLTGSFAAFDASRDYTGITGIQMDIIGVSDLDFTVDNVRVPEPATIALLGLGLAGAAFRRRKPVTTIAA